MKKIEFDYNKVKELYIDKKLSISKCAKELGVGKSTLNKYLIKEGFKKSNSKVTDVEDLDIKNLNIKNSSITDKKSKSKNCKEKVISLEDKINYCNKKYGIGNWRFLDKDEVLEMLIEDAELRKRYK